MSDFDADVLEIVRGRADDFDRQYTDESGNAYESGTTPFASDDALSCRVWKTPGGPELATPDADWVGATGYQTGEFRVAVAAADTADLDPGDYRYEVAVTRDGKSVTLDAGVFRVLAAPGETPETPPAYGGADGAPARLATVYCTDEDVLVRAPQDYVNLCPRSQTLAAGSDGAFDGSDPWTLTSASVDFESAGVAVGSVVLLRKPNAFGGAGLLMAVAGVDGDAVTLRRPGLAAGKGMPPATTAGLTGVTFEAATFAPQIDVASYDANKFFGIDPNVSGRSPDRLYDARELQQWAVLTVLQRAYVAAEKTAAGDFKLKLADVTDQLQNLQSRLVVRWGELGQGDPPTSVFSARVRR